MGWLFSYSKTDVNSSNADTTVKLNRSKTTGDAYGLVLDIEDILRGTEVSSRSWGIGILGDRIVAGDNDCAYLRINGTNYAANPATLNFRGLNCSVKNKGTSSLTSVVGAIENTISANVTFYTQTTTIKGLSVEAFNEGAYNPAECGGLDVCVCREGGAATKEYGVKVRTRGTINTALEAALLFEKGTDLGFLNLFKVDAAATLGIAALSGDVTFSSSGIKIPIKVDGTTYYIPAQPSL